MATVTSYTAEHMQEIEDATIVDAEIDGSGNLILTRHDGTTVNAGYVVGSVPSASTTVVGIAELATSAETITGTDTVRTTTPAGVAAAISAAITAAALPSASTTVQGKVELATDAEAITGTDTVRAVTPASATAAIAAAISAAVPSASTTAQGKVELATSAETITGTDTARAITPAGFAAALLDLLPRGVIVETVLGATSSAIGGTLTVVLTSASTLFDANRAYRWEIEGAFLPNTANTYMDKRVYKGTGTTTTLFELFRSPNTSAIHTSLYNSRHFKVGGTPVTAQISFGIAAGTGTVQLYTNAGSPTIMRIVDVGPASKYPNVPTLS